MFRYYIIYNKLVITQTDVKLRMYWFNYTIVDTMCRIYCQSVWYEVIYIGV